MAEAVSLRQHLKSVFDANQKALALESAKTVSEELRALGSDTYLDMVLTLRRRLDAATAEWEMRSCELARRNALE